MTQEASASRRPTMPTENAVLPSGEIPASGRSRPLVEALLVAVLSLVTFAPSLSYHFLPGDYDWLSLAKWGDAERTELLSFTAYRPYTGQLFGAAYALFGGESAIPYRVALLVIHTLNALLAGSLAARILRRPGVGWITAAIFAVAPASSEAVHSIAAFVYPCVTLLLFTGLHLYGRCIDGGGVVPWVLAVVCFGLSVPLREHWVAAVPLALALELAHGGWDALRRRGVWLRLGTIVVLGSAVFVGRHLAAGVPLLPSGPAYRFDLVAMSSRLLVSLERLVLPPIPVDIRDFRELHQVVGAILLLGLLLLVVKAPRTDRRRVLILVAALVISLTPFLPVAGEHVRQRFAYFGTAFAAGLAAYAISLGAERLTTRVSTPIILAVLAMLLLEQQAEFSRHYKPLAEEASARVEAYSHGVRLTRENDEIVFFVGDLEIVNVGPNLQSVRSTLRVLSDIERTQVVQFEAATEEEFLRQWEQLRERSGAQGDHMRVFIRGVEGYELVRLIESREPAKVVFATGPGDGASRTIYALLPRPPRE